MIKGRYFSLGIAVMLFGFLFVSSGNVAHALTSTEVDVICRILECDDDQKDKLDEMVSSSNRPKPAPGPSVCPFFQRSMRRGASDATTDGDVSKLQEFLGEQGFYKHGKVTGFFGPVTEEAVKEFQAEEGVVSSGDSDSTGFGVFGPRTRARLCQQPTHRLLKVVSPNGGEVWQQDEEEEILWKSSYVSIDAYDSEDEFADPNLFLDIKLHRVGRPCTYDSDLLSCATDSLAAEEIYTIAEDVRNDLGKYEWEVGEVKENRAIPDGYYRVRVVSSQTGRGDVSDRPFKIVSETPDNEPPVIDGVGGPSSLEVDEKGKWKIEARDPEGGYLKYHVDWGDEPVLSGDGYGDSADEAYSQTVTFTHSYSREGKYKIVFTVTDDEGQSARASLTVKVENEDDEEFRVIDPNGGEEWRMGDSEKIKWNYTTSSFVDTRGIDIELLGVGLSSSADSARVYTIALNERNDGSYTWNVGDILQDVLLPDKGLYRVRVTNTSLGFEDESDSSFTMYRETLDEDPAPTSTF